MIHARWQELSLLRRLAIDFSYTLSSKPLVMVDALYVHVFSLDDSKIISDAIV